MERVLSRNFMGRLVPVLSPRRKVQVRGMFDSLDDSDKKELRDELFKFLAAEKKDAGFQ